MKYKSIIKGKKGGMLGSTLSNFGSYVAFVLIVIIFLIFFKLQTLKIIENRITGLEGGIDANTILLNYLRTPMAGNDDEEIIVSDFIVNSISELYIDEDYEKFTSEINNLFEVFFSGKGRLMIISFGGVFCLYDSNNFKDMALSKECKNRQSDYKDFYVPEGNLKLPTPIRAEGWETIEVILQ